MTAKRLRGSATTPTPGPVEPLNLSAPPEDIGYLPPQTTPAESDEDEPTEDVTITIVDMPDTNLAGAGTFTPSPSAFDAIDEAASELADTTDDENMAKLLTALIDGYAELRDAVTIIGQQQQWTTDRIAEMFGQFNAFMSGGNPLKMLGQLMSGGKRNG